MTNKKEPTRLQGIVQKGWGREEIWATNELYCGKLMHFNTGAKFSMHFHAAKDETWYVLSGKFEVEVIDTQTAERRIEVLKVGDTWRNLPLEPHRLTCIEQGVIIEVSTADSVEDNYRVLPGDNQKDVDRK
jgi:mannose-6-phosphate isomerase-like protein (cupin superfamily)